jgi:hypothetical protein
VAGVADGGRANARGLEVDKVARQVGALQMGLAVDFVDRRVNALDVPLVCSHPAKPAPASLSPYVNFCPLF